MEKCLYHLRPQAGITGNFLTSLRRLKSVNFHAFVVARGKYEGREYLLERFIPLLDCTWWDTINLSAVHPTELRQSLQECGIVTGPMQAFLINPDTLDHSRLAVYDFNQKYFDAEGTYRSYQDDFVTSGAGVGETTKYYFHLCANEGKRPFRYLGIRHFLYKGEINVTGLPVVEA